MTLSHGESQQMQMRHVVVSRSGCAHAERLRVIMKIAGQRVRDEGCRLPAPWWQDPVAGMLVRESSSTNDSSLALVEFPLGAVRNPLCC